MSISKIIASAIKIAKSAFTAIGKHIVSTPIPVLAGEAIAASIPIVTLSFAIKVMYSKIKAARMLSKSNAEMNGLDADMSPIDRAMSLGRRKSSSKKDKKLSEKERISKEIRDITNEPIATKSNGLRDPNKRREPFEFDVNFDGLFDDMSEEEIEYWKERAIERLENYHNPFDGMSEEEVEYWQEHGIPGLDKDCWRTSHWEYAAGQHPGFSGIDFVHLGNADVQLRPDLIHTVHDTGEPPYEFSKEYMDERRSFEKYLEMRTARLKYAHYKGLLRESYYWDKDFFTNPNKDSRELVDTFHKPGISLPHIIGSISHLSRLPGDDEWDD